MGPNLISRVNNSTVVNYKRILLIFIVYTVFGAICEHMSYYFSKDSKRLSNPILTGFPIYGAAVAISLVLYDIMPIGDNIITQFVFFMIVFSISEVVYGLIVNAGPKSYRNDMIHHWDYSKHFLNYNGIISLKVAIRWGIIGVLLIRLHPYIMEWLKNLCP